MDEFTSLMEEYKSAYEASKVTKDWSARYDLCSRIVTKFLKERYPMLERVPLGLSVGPGWVPLISELCENLQKLNVTINVQQVKEKFAGLRFYADVCGDDAEKAFALIEAAEGKSNHTCEVCGVPGEHRMGGWIRTLCDAHA